MYNRYTPKSDGSYQRNRVNDQRQPQKTPQVPKQAPPPIEQPEPCRTGSSAPGFLKRLLPKEFDTGDLLVMVLLLLMAGDCEDEKNTALLTLALYFFM